MSTSPGDAAGQYQAGPYEQAQARPPMPAGQPYPSAPAYPYGQGPVPYQQVRPHSAALAVVASFFIPGLGSMLNDKVGKGIGILACYFLSAFLVFVVIGFITTPAIWIWGMVAANNDAHRWNRAHGIMS